MELTPETLLQKARRLEELNGHLTFRISRLAKLLEVEGAARVQNAAVNLTGYRMMLVISIFEEITVSDLSKVMVIDRAQISRAATDMIDRGLLEGRASRVSKRKKLLALTAAGTVEFQRLKAAFDQRQEKLEALLAEAEFAQFQTSVNRLSAFLEEEIQTESED